MKLASLKSGRDGKLVVVSSDLNYYSDASLIAPTLQAALDDWDYCEPQLKALYESLNHGAVPKERFHEREAASPLPRAYQWADGSAYVNHVKLVRQARGAEIPPEFWTDPLMYQGGSDSFLGPRDDIPLKDESYGCDLEGEVAVITDDVPMGVDAKTALSHIKLIMLCNDVSLRGLIPAELAKGFGFFHSKPASAFSPVAITPECLGERYKDGKVFFPLLIEIDGKPFGKAETGEQMWFYNRNDSSSLTVRGGAEPTFLNGQVLFGFSDGYIVALDAAKGLVIWEKQLGAGARFKDVDSKPVVDGDRIFVSNYDGNLYCLNAKDGKTLWSFEEGGYTPVTVVSDVVYYSTSTSAVVALERASGKLLWRKALANSIATQPIYLKGLILFGEWEGDLRALDARSGAEVASYATGRGVTSSPTLDIANDMAYVMSIDANLYAFHIGYRSAGEIWPWER